MASRLNRPEVVNFDFGQVLMRFDTQKWYDFIASRRRKFLSRISGPEFFCSELTARYDLGQIDEFEFFNLAKKILGLNVEIDKFFYEFTANMRPDLRILTLKQNLKQNGFKLAVVSNINRYHFEYVQKKWPEVFIGFDYLALSFRLGIKKPDIKIFDIPAKRLKAPPERCFLVDDLKVNIEAFEQWGGVGHHYNVTDDKFCPNGRLEIERNRLLLRMVNLGMLSLNQAGNIVRIDF